MNHYFLNKRHILVTGAAGEGVGAGVCEAVLELGGIPLINALNAEAAERACELHPGSIPAVADVSKEDEIQSMFEQLEAQRIVIHGLVNNAGVGLNCPSHEASAEQFDHLMGVDVRGLWLMVRSFVGHCRRRKHGGAVVNISSVHTQASIGNYAIYSAAKGAVESYTRAASIELAPFGIRVNAVAPGYIHSKQNLELIGSWSEDPREWADHHQEHYQALPGEITPVECGRAVTFLLSEASSAITGQTLVVDKGTTCLLYDKQFIPSQGKWSKTSGQQPVRAQ